MGLPCGITKYNKKANLKQIPQSKALAVATSIMLLMVLDYFQPSSL
ncbi:hypothetical protein V2I22_02480 [Campylobacter sp. CLAX-7218-21]|nr:hypothetical protein [uncultured Campylobacter sp.]MEE3711876.1 hypothetical protein [Campylobacter sp. CLAX-7218-21]